MPKIITLTLPQYECVRCGHVWSSYKAALTGQAPRACARCGATFYWRAAKKPGNRTNHRKGPWTAAKKEGTE